MAKFFLRPEFKDLECEWNKRLIASGFKDIEHTKHGERVLKQYAFNAYLQADDKTRLAREQYYHLIAMNVAVHSFNKLLDEIVMTKFAEGLFIKQIVLDLNKLGFSIHRQTVRFIVRRYEHEWGIKYWTLKERNLK